MANDILNGTVAPAWLADLSTTTVIPSPVIYRTVWNNYYAALAALLKAIQKRAKELADQAQTSANEALNRIDGIAADGVLSTTEIPDLKREFETAYRQREEMADLATDDTTHKLIDASLFAPLNTYLAAFKSLANYLNRQGGANGSGTYGAWTEPTGGTYSVSNSGTAANATYEIVAKSQLADADFPNLLGIDADVKFQANWASPTTDGDGGKKFRDLWADLERQRVALANAMATLAKNNADNAQQTADDAQDKIADIVSDGIISGGSEKTQLYKEWVRTKGEYFDYYTRSTNYGFKTFNTKPTTSKEYGYYQDDLAFERAFDALVLMLNGGTYGGGQSEVNKDYTNRDVKLVNGNELAWLYNLQADTVIGNYSYSENNTSVAYTATKYRQLWNNYYSASVKLLNDFTEYALKQLHEISSDLFITPSEKETLLIRWREIISEMPLVFSQADTFISNTSDSTVTANIEVYVSDVIAAFEVLAGILNDGDTYSYNLSTGIFPTPKWLSNYLGRTEELTSEEKEDFNDAWSEYYAQMMYLQDLLLEVAKKAGDDAQEDADKALGQLSDLADDNILTEQEKLTVLREWAAARKEFAQLTQQAAATHVGYTAYSNAYYKLANYLVDLTTDGTGNRQGSTVHNKTIDGHTYNFSVDYEYPQMLCYINGSTNISGSTFMAYWSNYYKERSNLLAALSASHVSYFVGSSVPSAPYYIGDLWLKLTSGSSQSASNVEENGEMMVCINDCTTAGDETEQDWANLKEITEKRDPRILLPMLAEKAYTLMGGFIRSSNDGYHISVYFRTTTPTGGKAGDLWYNGSVLKQYASGDGFEQISNDSLTTICNSLFNVLGTYTVHICGSKSPTGMTLGLYDLYVEQIQFEDTNLPVGNDYRTVTGGLEIQMYGQNGWEILQESTRSLIENLKGYVRMVAFGSANGTIQSAGIVTSQNFVNMFANAVDSNGKTITEAYLSAYITKVKVGNDYYLQSGVKISADQVELTGTDSISLLIGDVQDGLTNTGINIQNGKIELSASNTIINGNLNLYDEDNSGFTVYDESRVARVNIQSDSIGEISQMSSDTYNFVLASSSISTTSFNNTVTTSSIGTLSADKTIEVDKIVVTTYGSGSVFPTSYYPTLKVELLNGSTVVATKNVSLARQNQNNYITYKSSSRCRFATKANGTYYIRYTISGMSGTATSPVYLSINARIQTSDIAQTFIGKDGLYSHSGAHKIFWIGESEMQLRFGFNGIRWNDADVYGNKAMEVVTGVKGTSPNNKPVWLPFYNYIPTFNVGVGTTPYLFTAQYIKNISENKYAFQIDPCRDSGICVVQSGYIDTNFNQQDSWIILPPATFTDADGDTASLPIGYQVTIINWTSVNIYVVPYSSSNHGAVIVDANRNNNYYAELNGVQSRDTYIYVGTWAGLGETWLAMHDTQ
ncbi:MAG: hypothetical protein K6E45_02870 [Bacteroidaceae bacterium]|nr:hypothetical protein [Bacteroidaceae bacterium]